MTEHRFAAPRLIGLGREVELAILRRAIPGYEGGLSRGIEVDVIIRHALYADAVRYPELPQI